MIKINKPKIRFKNFNDIWSLRKLSDTQTDFKDGNYGEAYPKETDLTSSTQGVPFLRGSDLDNGKLTLTNARYITQSKHNELVSGHLIEDDIVIAVRGSLGSLGYVGPDNEGWNINSQLAIIRTRKIELIGNYLIQFLLSNRGNKEISSHITGTALKQLPIKQLKNIKVPIPKIEEQSAIGSLFRTLDDLLASYKDNLANYRSLKATMFSKMFPKSGQTVPEIRLDGFEDEWKKAKLKDVAHRVQGNDGRMDLPTLTISASGGWMNQIDRFSANIAGKEQKNYTLLKKGELSYNHGNSKLAKYGVVFELKEYEEALVPKVYHSFRVNQLADAKFIEIMFSTKIPDRELGKLVSSGARMDGLLNISFDDFMNIAIIIPTFAEQQAIGAYFSNLDNLINSYQEKISQLETLKKKLLQDMFI